MAWAIETNGITTHLETGTYENVAGSIFEIKFKTIGPPKTFGFLGSAFGTSDTYLRVSAFGSIAAKGDSFAGSNIPWPGGINIFDGEWHVLRFHCFATRHQIELDGNFSALYGPAILTDKWSVLGVYSSSLARFRGQIEYAKWINNGANNFNWDATASDHVPGNPIVKDISGNNQDALGIGFPTDGSAWINLGGGPVPTFKLHWIRNFSGVIT